MQGKTYLVGALGLCLALGGAFGLSHWHHQALEAERLRSSIPVLVALRGLNQGEALGPLDFRMSAWPADALPEGAIVDAAGIEGRVLTASLQRGEPILLGKLAPVGALTGLVQRISLGHRAVSLKVTDASAVNGFIQPGHRVDVIAYLPGSASAGLAGLSAQHPALTRGLIEDVLVIAVDREAQTDQGRPKSTSVLTLEIKAADVERFEHARQLGAISLALRPDGDNTPIPSSGQTSASLWSRSSTTSSIGNTAKVVALRPSIPRHEAAPGGQTANARNDDAPPVPSLKIAASHCVEIIEGLKASRECLP